MPIRRLLDESLFSGSGDTLRTAIGGFYTIAEAGGETTWAPAVDAGVHVVGQGSDEGLGFGGAAATERWSTYPLPDVNNRLLGSMTRYGAKETISQESIMMNYRMPVRVVGDELNVINDEHWKVILMGGSFAGQPVRGIYNEEVFNDIHTEVVYPYETKKIKRLKEHNSSYVDTFARNQITLTCENNYYVPTYQRYTDDLDSELLIPNIYIMAAIHEHAFDIATGTSPTFAELYGNWWDPAILNSISREKVVDYVSYFNLNEYELYSIEGLTPGATSIVSSLQSDIEAGSGGYLQRDYSNLITKYLPITVPNSPLSPSTEAVLTTKLKNVFFDQWTTNGFEAGTTFSDVLVKVHGGDRSEGSTFDSHEGAIKKYFPYYIKLNYMTGRAGLLTNIINRLQFSSKFLKTLKETFLEEINIAPTLTSFKEAFVNTVPSDDSGAVTEQPVLQDTTRRVVDFLDFMMYAYNNYKSTTDDGYFAGQPLAGLGGSAVTSTSGNATLQRKAAMDKTGDYRYFNTVTAWNVLYGIIHIFTKYTSADDELQIESLHQLFNAAHNFQLASAAATEGAEADATGLRAIYSGGGIGSGYGYSEVVAYRIEKIGGAPQGEGFTPEPIQNFWFINASENEYLNFYDTQVKYDKNYTYNLYSYTIAIGVKQKTSDIAITRKTSNAEASDGRHCLEFFDPITNEATPALFTTSAEYSLDVEEGVSLTEETFLQAGTLRTRARYVSDFYIEYEPTVKIIETQIYSKALKVLDNPPNKLNVLPFQLMDRSRKIGFGLSYGAFVEQTYPITISPKDLDYKQDYMNTYDLLDNEKIKLESISRPRYLEVYRLDERPKAYTDFDNNLLSTIDLKIPNQKTKTYSDETALEEYFYDKIDYNKKYYYAFRVLNEQRSPGHVTEIYEVEYVYDGNAPYAIFNTLYEEDLDENIFVNPSKKFKKLFQLRPNLSQVDFDDSGVTYSGKRAIEEIDNLQVGTAGDLIWDKKFKLRLTSKKTNKKIDLNFTYNLKSD